MMIKRLKIDRSEKWEVMRSEVKRSLVECIIVGLRGLYVGYYTVYPLLSYCLIAFCLTSSALFYVLINFCMF
jgi:hypothetical protein